MSPTGTRSSTRTARSLATVGILTKGSKRGPGSGWHRAGSNSRAATGQPCNSNLSATSGCSSPTQPASSSPTSTIAARPGCRYGLAAGTKRAPGTSRSARPFASKKPASNSETFQPAGRTVPASTMPILPASRTPMSPPASGTPSSPVIRNRSAASRRSSCGMSAKNTLPSSNSAPPRAPKALLRAVASSSPGNILVRRKPPSVLSEAITYPFGPVIQAEVIRPALGAERVGDSLRESKVSEQPPEHARLSLRLGKRPGLRNGRQPLWHSVEPDEPADLLDEVCLAAEIPPEGGNGSPQSSVLSLDLAPQGLQTSGRLIHLHGHAEQELGPAEPQRYTPGLHGLGVVAQGVIGGRSTRSLREQGTHPVHRVRHRVRVETAFEAAGGVGAQA